MFTAHFIVHNLYNRNWLIRKAGEDDSHNRPPNPEEVEASTRTAERAGRRRIHYSGVRSREISEQVKTGEAAVG